MGKINREKYSPSALANKVKHLDRSDPRYKATETLHYARLDNKNRMLFQNYDLLERGLLSAHPNINYFQTIQGKGTDLIGLEIEIEGYDSNPRKQALYRLLNKHLENLHFCCSDGSLNNGAEIVTAPMSRLEIKDRYREFYQFLSGLSAAGFTAHDSGTCGLHVHISRKWLSNTEAQKIAKFISQYGAIWKSVSRRTSSSIERYCQFRVNCHDKYRAVNFCHRDTIEFRFFRGTLNPKSFFSSIELILSLIECAKQSDKSITFKRFCKYLQNNSKRYPFAGEYWFNNPEVTSLINKKESPKSAEEREALKLERERRASERAQALEREVNSMLSAIQRGIPLPNPVIQHGQLPEVNQFEIRELPIGLYGRWPQRLMRSLQNRLIPVTVRKGQDAAGICVYRTSGWGRTRISPRIVQSYLCERYGITPVISNNNQ